MRAVQMMLITMALGPSILFAEHASVDFSSMSGDSPTPPPKSVASLVDSAWIGLRPTVAVFDLQGDLYSGAAAVILTDHLRSKVSATGYFQLIEPARTTALHDPHFGAMASCSELDCAWRASKLLHADYVMVGMVERVGTSTSMKLQVVDRENGEVVLEMDCESDLDHLVGTWIPNAVARMAILSPSALGPSVAGTSGGRAISPARQLRDKTEEYMFTKHSAVFLDIAGTVLLALGNGMVTTENQDCQDRYGYSYSNTAPSRCSDVRLTPGSVVFAAGAVVQALGIARTIQTIVRGVRLKRMEENAALPSVSLVPFYDPRGRSSGLVARMDFH